MKLSYRFTAFTLVLLTALISVAPVSAQTQRFNDVPPNHFAFDSINWVSDPANGSFMVGDARQNFNPNNTMTKFEAAQIFALAAGFRHIITALPPEEQEVFTRSFNLYRPFLDTMAEQFTRWNRIADREIAFLMYHGVLTQADVQGFVVRTGQTESLPLLTRQEAAAWTVRLIGRGPQARALTLPQPNPFNDDAQIGINYRRYVYYARNAGIVGGTGGNFNPTGNLTRAQLAVIFRNALQNRAAPEPPSPPTQPTTLTGIVAAVHLDTHVSITSAGGTETFTFGQNPVVFVDNVQRSPSFLQPGMTAIVILNAQRQILNITARTEVPPVQQPGPGQPIGILHTDEGFIVSSALNPPTITIRTQRVSITGQVIDETRTFTIAPTATITRGGEPAGFQYILQHIQVNDIAFFGFTGNVIHELEIMERERTLQGYLLESRPAAGHQIMVIEAESGTVYELRTTGTTEFSRGNVQNLNWDDIRIGDRITADVEFDRIISLHAVGIRSNTAGRLTEIRITERNSEITIEGSDGTFSTLIIPRGTFDVYSLRIGNMMQIMLDSREVIGIQIVSGTADNPVILGFIQSTHANNTIVVVEGQGAAARPHTILVNNATTITRDGTTLNFNGLVLGWNVHVELTGPQSNVARRITVLS